MLGFLLRAAVTALGLWVASEIFPGLQFASPAKLLVAAIMLGVVNAFVRPLAFILTLPLTVLTRGFFLLVATRSRPGSSRRSKRFSPNWPADCVGALQSAIGAVSGCPGAGPCVRESLFS